jgi:hypothetical protein
MKHSIVNTTLYLTGILSLSVIVVCFELLRAGPIAGYLEEVIRNGRTFLIGLRVVSFVCVCYAWVLPVFVTRVSTASRSSCYFAKVASVTAFVFSLLMLLPA